MAVSIKAFGSFTESALKDLFAGATGIHGSATIFLALTTDAPNQNTWATFADVTGEIADASYTAGGNALAGLTVTEAAKVVSIDANDTVFTALNKNFRYGIIYQSGGGDPLIAYVDNGGTLDVETAGPQDVTFAWPAGGFLTHTVA
jgi:hypothetical protein